MKSNRSAVEASGNVGQIGAVGYEREHYALFERLPQSLRKALAKAPISVEAGVALAEYNRMVGGGVDAKEADRILQARLKKFTDDFLAITCFAVYGPDHPAITRTFTDEELEKAGLLEIRDQHRR